MKWPFSLTSKPAPKGKLIADALLPAQRAVWESLSNEERCVVMLDMSTGPNPPKMLDESGRVAPLCAGTMILVCQQALRITPEQHAAMVTRLRAQFAQAVGGVPRHD